MKNPKIDKIGQMGYKKKFNEEREIIVKAGSCSRGPRARWGTEWAGTSVILPQQK